MPGARIRPPDWHSVERAARTDGGYANYENPTERVASAPSARLSERLLIRMKPSSDPSMNLAKPQADRSQSQSAAALHRDATGSRLRLQYRIPATVVCVDFREY